MEYGRQADGGGVDGEGYADDGGVGESVERAMFGLVKDGFPAASWINCSERLEGVDGNVTRGGPRKLEAGRLRQQTSVEGGVRYRRVAARSRVGWFSLFLARNRERVCLYWPSLQRSILQQDHAGLVDKAIAPASLECRVAADSASPTIDQNQAGHCSIVISPDSGSGPLHWRRGGRDPASGLVLSRASGVVCLVSRRPKGGCFCVGRARFLDVGACSANN